MTLSTWCAKYAEIGLLVLYDQPRSGRPVEIDGNQRAKITALACSEPPQGYARWSLRLLADKVVELEYCDHISLTEVGGGIVVGFDSSPTIEGNTITGNSSEIGGGIAVSSDSTPTVVENEFEDNIAEILGGAIWVTASATLILNTPEDNIYLGNEPGDIYYSPD